MISILASSSEKRMSDMSQVVGTGPYAYLRDDSLKIVLTVAQAVICPLDRGSPHVHGEFM